MFGVLCPTRSAPGNGHLLRIRYFRMRFLRATLMYTCTNVLLGLYDHIVRYADLCVTLFRVITSGIFQLIIGTVYSIYVLGRRSTSSR